MDSSIIVAIIGAGVTVGNVILTNFLNRKRNASEREKAMAEGLQCLLRAEIIRSHDKYSAKNFCPIYAKESLTKAYKAYHDLGGNDVATALYEDIMRLPESENEGGFRNG